MIKYYLNKLYKIGCSPSLKKEKKKKKSILKRKVGNKLNVHFFLFIKLFYRIISFTILIIQNSRNISIEILIYIYIYKYKVVNNWLENREI